MGELSDYTSVFTAAPLATILLVYIYLNNKAQQAFMLKMTELTTKFITEQTSLLNETIRQLNK